MGEHAGAAERELTDAELIAIYEETVEGVKNGTIPTFGDAESLREDVRRRFGL